MCAIPELKAQLKAQSGSNASDFIRFDGDYYSLVALVGDRPVALIVAKKRSLTPPLQDEQEAYIDIIEVQPEYQRQGVGTALMERVLAWARENQVTQVRDWSRVSRL